MKKPTLKMINELKDSTNVSLLDRITERFKHSRINYKNDEQMMQAIGIANLRIGMASAHNFLEETTKAQRRLKAYLAQGRNHRILLDCFWIMQSRGDKNIILGDQKTVDSLAFAMKKIPNLGRDGVMKILSDGTNLGLFKRVKNTVDKRRTAYEIVATPDLIQAYISWGNTLLGITKNLYLDTIQGAWDAETQEALFRQINWYGGGLLSIEQENEMNDHFGEGSITRK